MTDPRGEVRLALSNFPDDPELYGRRLRLLAGLHWGDFAQEADAVIRTGDDTPALRFLVALYASRGELASCLARLVEKHRENGRKAVRLAARIIPDLGRDLAQEILSAPKSEDSAGKQAALLEALAEIERFDTATPASGHPCEADESGVRSRLALMVGRVARAQAWIRTLREEPDPGVRANALESLSEGGGAFAVVCCEAGLSDTSHRVVANSALGLYRMGDSRGVERLAEMASREESEFQSAAAWAMGESRDARFVPLLWKLRRCGVPEIAAAASAGCEKILLAQAAANREHASVLTLGAHVREGGDVVARAVVLGTGGSPVVLRQTDWRLKLDSKPVWRYSVRPVEAFPRMAVVLLVPRSADAQLIRDGLKAKRPGDSVAILRYAEELPGSSQGSADCGPKAGAVLLTTDARLAVRAAGSPQTSGSDRGMLEAASSCLPALREFPGDRRLLVLCDQFAPEWNGATARELVACSVKAGVSIHGICTPRASAGAYAEIRGLAADSNGFVVEMESLEGLPACLAAVFAALIRHYEMVIPSLGRANILEAEIANSRLCGRGRWQVDQSCRGTDVSRDIHWDREIAPALDSAGGDCGGMAPADSAAGF